MSETLPPLRQILEATLFTAQEPLSIRQLQHLFEESERPSTATLAAELEALATEYHERGVHLVATGGGYQFQTSATTTPWVHRLWQRRPPRLSRAVLETLAIIAYRQPITRAEIEEIRGVNLSSEILKTLTEREWIRTVGRKDIPGRPFLYGTTPTFLAYFGLSSLDELPPLKAIQEEETEHLLERVARTTTPGEEGNG